MLEIYEAKDLAETLNFHSTARIPAFFSRRLPGINLNRSKHEIGAAGQKPMHAWLLMLGCELGFQNLWLQSGRPLQQTLEGSSWSESRPNFASKYSCCNIFEIHNIYSLLHRSKLKTLKKYHLFDWIWPELAISSDLILPENWPRFDLSFWQNLKELGLITLTVNFH